MRTRLLASLLVPAVLAGGCVTETTSTRTWGDPYARQEPAGQDWVRAGRVQSIREVRRQTHGDPGAGAVAGAFLGGLFGSILGGPNGGGASTFFGAVTGAAVGAAASQGSAEQVWYEVLVRFEDGGYRTFSFWPPVPFRVGDYVQLTPQGLTRPGPGPGQAPPPPPEQLPPPPPGR